MCLPLAGGYGETQRDAIGLGIVTLPKRQHSLSGTLRAGLLLFILTANYFAQAPYCDTTSYNHLMRAADSVFLMKLS